MSTKAEQLTNDLLWAINSPSLIDRNEKLDHHVNWNILNRDEIDGDRLIQFCRDYIQARTDSPPSIFPVGKYFEKLIFFYLQEIQGFEIVANGEQVFEGGQTVGEFDFLYRGNDGELTHLETSVKFYLQLVDGFHNGSRFVGPNSSDTFERKTDRLFGHQLSLSRKYRPDVTRRVALVKGRIYRHAIARCPIARPPLLSQEPLTGQWIHSNHIQQLDTPERTYRLLRKPHWLNDDVDGRCFDPRELWEFVEQHFQANSRPLHFAMLRQNAAASNLFVVAPCWPEQS